MPLARAAAQSAGQPVGMPPMPPAGGAQMPAAQANPTTKAMPIMGGMPAPSAPAAPPYQVRLQSDGSSVFYIPSPDGDQSKDVVLGRNDAPKLPKAFQQQATQPQQVQ